MGAAVRRKATRRALAALALPGLVLVVSDPVDAGSGSAVGSMAPSRAVGAGEIVEGSYIVMLTADPVVTYEGGEPGLAATAPATGSAVDADDPDVQEYVDFLEAEQDAVLDAVGISANAQGSTYTYALNGFEAQLTDDQVENLARQPGVMRIVPNEIRQVDTDASPRFLGLTRPAGPWAQGITGEDVVVGVIDTGIWPEHPSFADDGSYAPLDGYTDLPCEFGRTAYNPDDARFRCNNKLLGAYDMRAAYKAEIGPETYNSARDYDGHGTHTASTAIGNRNVVATIFGLNRGMVSGIAPRARVIAYSVCGEQGCFNSDTVDAIDQAVADAVQVINYSIGGGASVSGPDELAFLLAADAGVWVAASAGNSGPGASTIGGPSSAPWVTSVGANTHDRAFANKVRLNDGTFIPGVSLTESTNARLPLVDAEDLGNELCESTEPFSADITDKIVLCLRGGNARVDKSYAVYLNGGAGMVLYNPTDVQALVTDNHWVPSSHINYSNGLVVKAYIDAAGADARANITKGVIKSAQGSVMADFSSRGPNPAAADIIKPDVTAPGISILAGNTPTPTAGRPGQLFQAISGTSMSSPHTAGTFALLRQAHPDWTAAMAKSALMTTARQDVVKEDTTTAADPFDMGAGHIKPGPARKHRSLYDPGLVYDAGFLDYAAFLCSADPSVFADPEGTCAFLEGLGYSLEPTDLNLASIGSSNVPGTRTVTRTVTSVADQTRFFRARVKEPEGFSVTVSPNHFTLDPGESQTFTVTFTNQTASLDTWTFGALKWKSPSGYRVRSPIAVRASEFEAPEAVSGEGTEGSVEIPVFFGYTGDYTAGAHGPVAAEHNLGTVDQDPDQTFDPADPTGTTAVPFTLADTAYLRLALTTDDLDPPDPNIDLDLYLYRGDELVGASTSGSTDELIELSLPEDGDYTLYVHGWQTGGETVGFDVRSWSVPGTPDTGALTIDSAPTEAVQGESGTVVASWSGLDADETYIGAVSHTGDSGLLGLTLVEIAT